MTRPPPATVLERFGVAGRTPVPLPGGRSTAWRAGDVVLKPLDLAPAALRWQEEVLSSVAPDGFRVAVPLRSRRGELVVGGWTAWPALDGAHAPRWPEIIAVGERFHRALAAVPRPSALLDARTDPWARADRIAWGEAPAGDLARIPDVARLLGLREPAGARQQLVHGDLSGNVLFAPGLPPAVIDLSPYWRPAAYASAIVAVDAVLWHGADAAALVPRNGAREARGLVVRALLFRLLADADPAAAARTWRPAIDRLLDP